jgi:hypothetical protein
LPLTSPCILLLQHEYCFFPKQKQKASSSHSDSSGITKLSPVRPALKLAYLGSNEISYSVSVGLFNTCQLNALCITALPVWFLSCSLDLYCFSSSPPLSSACMLVAVCVAVKQLEEIFSDLMDHGGVFSRSLRLKEHAFTFLVGVYQVDFRATFCSGKSTCA